MADYENLQPREAVRFNWQNHVGLIVGAATATLVCIKILAVANWDMNTAFGVLAATEFFKSSGTRVSEAVVSLDVSSGL